MKMNPDKNRDYCLDTAYETFTDLLSQREISEDEMDELEEQFLDIMRNEEYEEKWIEAGSFPYTPLHTNQYEDINDFNLFAGVIVVLKEGDKSVILDGNHRVNTLKEHYPDTQVLTIIIELS